MDPMESQSSTQAVSRARMLAVTKAGAVAFSRTGDPDIGEFADAVVLFTAACFDCERTLIAQDHFFRRILSIAFPRASSSISLSK